MLNRRLVSFHTSFDRRNVNSSRSGQTNITIPTTTNRQLSYQFYNHLHPYVTKLVEKLISNSVAGLQAADTEYIKKEDGSFETFPLDYPIERLRGKPKPELFEEFFDSYVPSPSDLVSQPHPVSVEQPHPVNDLDFSSSGAYSVYNWELFFHVPLTIAIHLSKNQRFQEAQNWFHYIFDPTEDSEGETPERFWKVKPFQFNDVQLVEDVLINLSSGADPDLQQDTINSINALKDAPFSPHVVARYRQTAYMFKTVMAYLDNLIDWGDSLFRQDTRESINEAMMLYVLAANILGPKPQAVPKKGSLRPQTYARLRKDLDQLGNVLREVETEIPFDLLPHPTDVSNVDSTVTIQSLGKSLYFCVPRNDKLMSYWDTVSDRLYKIRNSLNIQGVFRQLPLFEPPIDPALLAKAAASGLDVGAVISGINQPLPLVRFQIILQKATEICQEVKSLGNQLLSAIEKEDNEAIAMLRAKHELHILKLAENLRYAQWQEAIKNREGLEQSLTNAIQRYIYYERQLGSKVSEIQIPKRDELDKANLEKMAFRQKEPLVKSRPISINIAEGLLASAAGFLVGGKLLSSYEVAETLFLEGAQLATDIGSILNSSGSIAALLPNFAAHITPWGLGARAEFGGTSLSNFLRGAAEGARTYADRLNFEARRASRIDSFARREQEWAFQSNNLAGEITQTLKQLRAAQIREAISEKEWHNHKQQIKNAEDIELFLSGEETNIGQNKHKKISTQSFYTWMKREVRGLYGQCFQFAFDVAKKAERALQHELGKPELNYLQFNYLSGKESLLAGEKLYLDIKRMEMAYHDLNQREYELTKHVSLLQVNPQALLELRSTGKCRVSLPEELFDLDCPGHYFRRIKNVAVSIPCVTGPYTSVNCTLTLTKSSIRKNSLGDDYARTDAEDQRFSDHYGSLQSIVTSTGQNDTGLFEANFRDERYLPFENSGVISEWQLQLPANPGNKDPLQFDYNTISDVIIHIRYMAREGGELFRNKVIANLTDKIGILTTLGSVRLFSIRHEFPSEWAKFKSVEINGGTSRAELKIDLVPEHYPFWSKGRLEKIKGMEVFANTEENVEIFPNAEGSGEGDSLNASLGNLKTGSLNKVPLSDAIGPLTLYFNNNSMTDLWLAVNWGNKSD